MSLLSRALYSIKFDFFSFIFYYSLLFFFFEMGFLKALINSQFFEFALEIGLFQNIVSILISTFYSARNSVHCLQCKS